MNKTKIDEEFIFVYGTLQKNFSSDMHVILERHCDFISDGYMRGKLFEVNGYPGAIQSEEQNDLVYGEIYKIISNAELVLSQLDEYEECNNKYPHPHEYERAKCLISLSNEQEKLIAWVYIFKRNISNLNQIKSGHYLSDVKK